MCLFGICDGDGVEVLWAERSSSKVCLEKG